jgi:hypothetical protein
MLLKGGVVVLVEITHHVVGDVEQGDRCCLDGAGQGQAGGQERGAEDVFHCSFLVVREERRGTMPATIAGAA